MASSKEMQTSSRPLPQQRTSISSGSPSLGATRPSHSRNSSHTHSTLSGSLNAHRVTRRKSMSNPLANNPAAVAAALEEVQGDKVSALPIAVNSRRTVSSKLNPSRPTVSGSMPSPPASLPSHKFMLDAKVHSLDSAIDDDPNEMSADEGDTGVEKTRVRRASDGQPLTKDGKKSSRIEIKCEKCGKGYKHNSCLAKHLWEHTPQWSYTSKLLISKHQQVQLLEAASVLMAINTKEDSENTPPESTKDFGSDRESASPDASPYSDIHDGRSSADTTPPPYAEGIPMPNSELYRDTSKQFGAGSYSRSFQSGASGSYHASSIPTASGFGHNRHGSTGRPPSSGHNRTSVDDRELAAGLEALSWGSRDARLPLDAPPVPPLPPQFADQSGLSSSFLNSFPNRQMPESFTRGEIRRNGDVNMEDSESSVADDDEDERRSRARGSEDEEMMFGHMEE